MKIIGFTPSGSAEVVAALFPNCHMIFSGKATELTEVLGPDDLVLVPASYFAVPNAKAPKVWKCKKCDAVLPSLPELGKHMKGGGDV